MPIGLNLLFRLGRRLLAAPLEDTGWLPDTYYSSQALAALEEDDFTAALRYLKLSHNYAPAARLVSQLLILRCRLLTQQHRGQRQAMAAATAGESNPGRVRRYEEILAQEDRALTLLQGYAAEAGAWLEAGSRLETGSRLEGD